MEDMNKGVNLGGWLVLERWIAPSLFKETTASDEFTLCTQLGEQAERRITEHRETFINEKHFKQIADLGLTYVRIPVGHWLFGNVKPYTAGADIYIDSALRWAEQNGLKVILDFHAAPGSQNGWDHSGKSGDIRWTEPDNIATSLKFIKKLTKRYGSHRSLIAVEPLNEPHWEVDLDVLVAYYQKSAAIIDSNCHGGVVTMVSDAFRPEKMSKALRRARINVVLDLHLYQLFTPEDRALDLSGHLRKTEKEWSSLLRKLSKHNTLFIGEWSAAMSELYSTVGEPQYSYNHLAYTEYAQEQQRVFSSARTSWTYWTARTEDRGVWSLLDHPEYLA